MPTCMVVALRRRNPGADGGGYRAPPALAKGAAEVMKPGASRSFARHSSHLGLTGSFFFTARTTACATPRCRRQKGRWQTAQRPPSRGKKRPAALGACERDDFRLHGASPLPVESYRAALALQRIAARHPRVLR